MLMYTSLVAIFSSIFVKYIYFKLFMVIVLSFHIKHSGLDLRWITVAMQKTCGCGYS